jgi:hypothetical protein
MRRVRSGEPANDVNMGGMSGMESLLLRPQEGPQGVGRALSEPVELHKYQQQGQHFLPLPLDSGPPPTMLRNSSAENLGMMNRFGTRTCASSCLV